MEPTHSNIKPAQTKLNGMARTATHVATGKPPAFTPGGAKPAQSLDAARATRAAEVAKSSPALVEPSDSTTPVAATPSTSTPATPTKTAKPAVPAPTHVSVPVATLQAMHDAFVSHADAVRALLPVTDSEADIAARTAARLKAQGA